MPSFIASLRAALLTTAHRDGREKHHEHDCYGDHDDDDSCPYGEGDQQGLVHSRFLRRDCPNRIIPARRGTYRASLSQPRPWLYPGKYAGGGVRVIIDRYVLQP